MQPGKYCLALKPNHANNQHFNTVWHCDQIFSISMLHGTETEFSIPYCCFAAEHMDGILKDAPYREIQWQVTLAAKDKSFTGIMTIKDFDQHASNHTSITIKYFGIYGTCQHGIRFEVLTAVKMSMLEEHVPLKCWCLSSSSPHGVITPKTNTSMLAQVLQE